MILYTLYKLGGQIKKSVEKSSNTYLIMLLTTLGSVSKYTKWLESI